MNGGDYDVIIQNYPGETVSRISTLIVTNDLWQVFTNSGLSWIVGGNSAWFYQDLVTHGHFTAAQSGVITSSQETWMETDVTGPGRVTFWWKVSSEINSDVLQLQVGGVERLRISGEVDWQHGSVAVPPGRQILRWRYAKNDSVNSGLDAGWVSEINFSSETTATARMTGEGLYLGVFGPDLIDPVVIYASTNLADWEPISTNLPIAGTVYFLDASATNLQRRFYRSGPPR